MTTRSPAPLSAAEQLAALRRVQRRVGAIAFFAVAIHGVLGLIVVAHVVKGQGRDSDAVLLLVMSAAFAIVTYGVVRIILAARLWSPIWIALSLVPTVIGFIWVL
jgi:Kef-type K+ transport system membrane component KefB